MKKIVIVGAGGHGQVVADILFSMFNDGLDCKPCGFLDDDVSLKGNKYLNLEVLGTTEEIEKNDHNAVIIGIGNNKIRAEKYRQFFKKGENVVNAIHPRATIAGDVILGNGIMCCAGVVVNNGSVIKDNVIINTGSTVDHHNQIGSHVHIAPGVHLGGEVKIEEGTLVGIGSTVIPGITIGEWSVIGAGSVVTKDIPSFATAVGIPARVIKRGE